MTKLYGSLEAGGTKFVCAVGDENFNIVEKKTQFPTTTPIETIDKPSNSFQNSIILQVLPSVLWSIDIDKTQKTYGFITTTPNLTGQM